jgi:hypothetical protein
MSIVSTVTTQYRRKKYTTSSPSARDWETQLAVGLPSQDLCNCVSYRDARLLDLLLREARGDADLERGMELPPLVLGIAVGRHGHTLETGDEHAVRESLRGVLERPCVCR